MVFHSFTSLVTHYLAFTTGVSLFFLLFFAYSILKNNPAKVSIRSSIKRIILFGLIVTGGHSVLLFCIYLLLPKYKMFETYQACLLFGFVFTASPIAVLSKIIDNTTETFSEHWKGTFRLLTTLKEIYFDNIINEINYRVRYQAWQIVAAQKRNDYRGIHKLFEEYKTLIALHYRDFVFNNAAKAFGIFEVRNVQIKNGYLLMYFDYPHYTALLKHVNSATPIQLNGWDCVERRKAQKKYDLDKGQKRFYNHDSFRESFMKKTLASPFENYTY